jgi:hypothetical protein
MNNLKVGNYWGKGKNSKRIIEIKKLSNGWFLIKTENSKSENDFRVKAIFSLKPPRSMCDCHTEFKKYIKTLLKKIR